MNGREIAAHLAASPFEQPEAIKNLQPPIALGGNDFQVVFREVVELIVELNNHNKVPFCFVFCRIGGPPPKH